MRLLRKNALELAQSLHILQVCVGVYERDLRLSALADEHGLVAFDCLLGNFGEIRAELLGAVMLCHDFSPFDAVRSSSMTSWWWIIALMAPLYRGFVEYGHV